MIIVKPLRQNGFVGLSFNLGDSLMFYPTFIFHTPYINKKQLFLLIKRKTENLGLPCGTKQLGLVVNRKQFSK